MFKFKLVSKQWASVLPDEMVLHQFETQNFPEVITKQDDNTVLLLSDPSDVFDPEFSPMTMVQVLEQDDE